MYFHYCAYTLNVITQYIFLMEKDKHSETKSNVSLLESFRALCQTPVFYPKNSILLYPRDVPLQREPVLNC